MLASFFALLLGALAAWLGGIIAKDDDTGVVAQRTVRPLP